MAQGRGFWYNPKTNVALEVNRHEHDIKKPEFQKKISFSPAAADALKEMDVVKDENEIKMLAAKAGLVRTRDWNKFLSIQFFAKGKQVIEVVFALAQLIEKAKNKKFTGLTPSTKEFAQELANQWTLRVENLSTGNVETLSPDQLISRQSEDGFMEGTIEEETNKRPIKDIVVRPGSWERVNYLLKKHNFFEEQKNKEVESLFEDRKVFFEKQQLNEALTLSRVWKMANDGEHIFALVSAHRTTENPEQSSINEKRTEVLKKVLRGLGYGFNEIDGYWIEAGQEKDVDDIDKGKEKSFFVSVKIPENEINMEEKGSTVSKFKKDMSEIIKGDKEEDDTVPEYEKVLNGRTGFNQDAVAIKLNPIDKNVYLMGRDMNFFPLGEIEFFKDIRNTIRKLPKETLEKIKNMAGGISFSELIKKKKTINKSGAFRAGDLKQGR